MNGIATEMDDEFALLPENAAEAGLRWRRAPEVRRVDVPLDGGQVVSALVWGSEPAELVLLHGGAQNAHTWDTVALALGRPLVAIDLPGHGRSSWRDDHDYGPAANAEAVAQVMRRIAPRADAVVGMSLGALTAIRLAAADPDLLRQLVIVDVTPGVNREKAAAIHAFVDGPQSFPSFEDLLARTVEHNPTRSVSSLKRGILHNARQQDDGTWVWRYDRTRSTTGGFDAAPLWDDVAALLAPVMLVRGALSPVVDDEDVAEFVRLQPDTRVEVVDGAGHSVQGDRPVELARLIVDFTQRTRRATPR